MKLFAIADLHLSLGTDKPMDSFPGWHDYVSRLERGWKAVVGEEDTVVIAGDISWGMSLEEARPDFAFIHSLPGRKLLLKGNHDYWWTTRKKMDDFFVTCGFDTLTIIHNTAQAVGKFAVCGTRGWFFDAEADGDKKVLNREVGRLGASLDAAEKIGGEPVVFLHYPPVCGGQSCPEILSVLQERKIARCYYGHIHGAGIRRAFQGDYHGIQLKLISGDSLGFVPLLVG